MDFKEAFKESCEAYDSQEDMLSTVPYRMGLFEPFGKRDMEERCKAEFGRSFDQVWRFCRKGAESKDRELLRMAAAKGTKGAVEILADRSKIKRSEEGGITIALDIPRKGED